MAIPVTAKPLAFPADYLAPATTQGVIDKVSEYTEYSADDNSELIVVSASQPTVADQSRVWLRTDTFGRPVAFFTYYVPNPTAVVTSTPGVGNIVTTGGTGAWRRVYEGCPNEIRIFSGDPSIYFDGTGLGLTTKEWDGWALCNGSNGTPDLRDRFVVVVSPAFSQLAVGGSANLTIALNQLPQANATIPLLADFGLGGGLPGFAAGPLTYSITADGTGRNLPISTLPPFVAEGFVQFVGYA